MEEIKKVEDGKKKKPTRQELEAVINDFKDKWLRTTAEFENFRKRTLKEKEDLSKYATEKVLLDVCDVYDNFERAMDNKPENDKTCASYIKGVELIYQQLGSLLKKHNVIKLDVLGKDFDPHFHEAVSTLPSDKPQNAIIAVVQNGYMMCDKVIRHSRVVVSKGEQTSDS